MLSTLLILSAALTTAPETAARTGNGRFLPTFLHRSSSEVLSSLPNCEPVQVTPLWVACRASASGVQVRATFAFDPAQTVQSIVVDHPAAASRDAALAQVRPWLQAIRVHYGPAVHQRPAASDEVVIAGDNLVAIVRTKRAADGGWVASSHLSDPSRQPRIIKTL